MKRILCAMALLCCVAAGALGAANGLMPVKIYLGSHDDVYRLNAQGVRIEELRSGYVEARLTPDEMDRLAKQGWRVEVRTPETIDPKILSAYHGYNWITALLDTIHNAHPSITRKVSYGTSYSGHPLWAFLVTSDPDSARNKAEVRLAGNIHGDEKVGTEMLLGMIDSLTNYYGTVSEITNLVNTREIWFIPTLNPDGNLAASRYNGDGEDLNRDFPVPDGGTNQGLVNGTEPETQAFMNYWSTKRIVLSLNYHGGALVANYPWDYTYTLCPDDTLAHLVSLGYSRLNPPMHASTSFDSGVTNGAVWYIVRGSLQDWSYHMTSGLDITVECSDIKTPAGSTLPGFWDDNRNSLLYYIRQAGWGVQGVVTDSLTGVPLNQVQVDVAGINKSVYSDTVVGDYHRMLITGTYSLTFSKAGYRSKTVNNVYVKLDSVTTRNVQLAPLTGVVSQPAERPLPIRTDLFYSRPNPLRDRTVIGYQLQRPGPACLRMYNAAGQLVRTLDQGSRSAGYHAVTWDGRDGRGAAVSAGVYIYRLDAGGVTRTNKLVVVR